MIYRSNIKAPDLRSQFAATTISKIRPWSMGHEVLSDAICEPDCTFMTDDEAALLYDCARRLNGEWVDIGSRFGWTSAHIAAAGAGVICVDPHFSVPELASRFRGNFGVLPRGVRVFDGESIEFFVDLPKLAEPQFFDGICIDGNHDSPEPLNDARNALAHLKETGVIILHDFWGQPVRDAVNFLIDAGLKCRIYNTPNGMAVCWRGDFEAPDHKPDPAINWAEVRSGRAPEFDFGRTI